jgi:hypothetical protein
MQQESNVIPTPDVYTPKWINHEYRDVHYISSSHFLHTHPHGVLCPCTNHVFTTKGKFDTHRKCKRHRKWMLVLSEGNPLEELQELRQTCKSQKIIICSLSNLCETYKHRLNHLHHLNLHDMGVSIPCTDLVAADSSHS